jgi:hypothetical protein
MAMGYRGPSPILVNYDGGTNEIKIDSFQSQRPPIRPVPEDTFNTNPPYQLVSKAVKVATPETYELYPTSPDKIVAAQMLLEILGGNELIEISRHDLINGYGIKNQPIKDAQIIATQFNAFNIIPLQDTLPNYLDNFPIKLEEKLPNIFSGESNVTVDSNGIITIELINLRQDELVEVEIFYQGEILDTTTYSEGESS